MMSNNDSLLGDAALPADRARRCTAEGKEYFLAENRKNRNSYCRTILKHVTQIEGLLQNGNLQEVHKIHESLSEVFQDFLRAHSRCQELLESEADQTKETKLLEEIKDAMRKAEALVSAASLKNSQDIRLTYRQKCHDEMNALIQQIEGFLDEDDLTKAESSLKVLNEVVADYIMYSEEQETEEEKRLSDKLLHRVTELREKVSEATAGQVRKRSDIRQSLYNDIQEKIEEVENHILEGNLQQADTAVAVLDNIFSEFMSTSCDAVADQDVDTAQEGRFTHIVDNAVFTVKSKLAKAKSRYEVGYQSNKSLSKVASNYSTPRKRRTSPSKKPHSHTRSPRSSTSRSSSRKSKDKHRRKGSPGGSHKSGSVRSSGSSISSSSSTRSAKEKAMEERARLAALRVESRYLEQTQKSILEKKRLEMEAERLEVEKEMAIAEAKAKVYDEEIEDEEKPSKRLDNYEDVISKKEPISSSIVLEANKTSVEVKPVEDPATSSTPLHHLNDLCNLLKASSAPDVDMDVFDGNPLEFQYFMSLFEQLVERKIDDPLGRLARLIKYTKGEAKELIQHCVQMPQPEGFKLAKELLKKEYGNPHKVTAAYMKELRTWQTIKAGDVNEFKKYHRFLLKCKTNSTGDTYLRLLDNQETLRLM